MKFSELRATIRRFLGLTPEGKTIDPEREDPRPPDYDDGWMQQLREWDRKSVRDIPLEPFDTWNTPNARRELVATVPAALATTVTLATDPSVWPPASRQAMQILAIDQAGEALVEQYKINGHTCALACYVEVLSPREAIAQFEAYRGGPVSPSVLRALHLEPMATETPLQTPDNVTTAASKNVEQPAPGQTCVGPITDIDDAAAYQDINATTRIAHALHALIGVDVIQLHGKVVEIRYPHGSVGLAHLPTDRAFSSPEWDAHSRDHDGPDRTDRAY